MDADQPEDPGAMCLLAYARIRDFASFRAGCAAGSDEAKLSHHKAIVTSMQHDVLWLHEAAMGKIPNVEMNAIESDQARLIYQEMHDKHLSGAGAVSGIPFTSSNQAPQFESVLANCKGTFALEDKVKHVASNSLIHVCAVVDGDVQDERLAVDSIF